MLTHSLVLSCILTHLHKHTRTRKSAAQEVHTGRAVAIKKICKVFECLTDAVRTLREIKLLHHFRHENVCSVLVFVCLCVCALSLTKEKNVPHLMCD